MGFKIEREKFTPTTKAMVHRMQKIHYLEVSELEKAQLLHEMLFFFDCRKIYESRESQIFEG